MIITHVSRPASLTLEFSVPKQALPVAHMPLLFPATRACPRGWPFAQPEHVPLLRVFASSPHQTWTAWASYKLFTVDQITSACACSFHLLPVLVKYVSGPAQQGVWNHLQQSMKRRGCRGRGARRTRLMRPYLDAPNWGSFRGELFANVSLTRGNPR